MTTTGTHRRRALVAGEAELCIVRRLATRDADRHDAVTLHPVGAQLQLLEAHDLPLLRHVPEQVQDQAADGVPLGVGQVGAEDLADLVDRCAAPDADGAIGEHLDPGQFDVVLVGDLADDFLEQVFQRHQT